MLPKAVVNKGAGVSPGPRETGTRRATGLTMDMLRLNERRSLEGMLDTVVGARRMRGGVGIGFWMDGVRGGVGIGFGISSAEDTIFGGDLKMGVDAGEPAKILVPDFRS